MANNTREEAELGMEVTEALEEAHERWGEAAAIYRDGSRRPAHYEVGYFGRRGDGLVFYPMGRGVSLEQALETAFSAESQGFNGLAQSASRLV